MGKQKTIRDVAKLAGVSVATASRVINNVDYPVRPQLKQKVQDAIQQLNYVPNAMARALRQEDCYDIGLIVPNLSNPFYLQSIHGIEEVLHDNGYNIILCNTMQNPSREREFLQKLYERQVKGVILSSVNEFDSDTVLIYIRRGMKFVLLDQMLRGIEGVSINYDLRSGARIAVEHLIESGHRKIAFATTPMIRWTRREMFKGYQEGLTSAGIPLDSTLVFEHPKDQVLDGAEYELNVGKSLAERFIHGGCPATAIICVNDMVAIGCIQYLLRSGVRIPQDVSVIGFDDIPFAAVYTPALTTVRYPAQEIGRLAAIMLLDAVRNKTETAGLAMNFAPELVIRDTVAPPKTAL